MGRADASIVQRRRPGVPIITEPRQITLNILRKALSAAAAIGEELFKIGRTGHVVVPLPRNQIHDTWKMRNERNRHHTVRKRLEPGFAGRQQVIRRIRTADLRPILIGVLCRSSSPLREFRRAALTRRLMVLLEVHQPFAATVDRHGVTLPQRRAKLCTPKTTHSNHCRQAGIDRELLARSAERGPDLRRPSAEDSVGSRR
jgi:hypothetical protein